MASSHCEVVNDVRIDRACARGSVRNKVRLSGGSHLFFGYRRVNHDVKLEMLAMRFVSGIAYVRHF